MGREIRKVHKDWIHPKDEQGRYIPLFGKNYSEVLKKWIIHKEKWDEGYRENSFGTGWVLHIMDISYEEWDGPIPLQEQYLPEWSESEKTHIQLYENTSEGTPLSGVYKSEDIEELCEYASEKCTIFSDIFWTKEEWCESFGVKIKNKINLVFV